MTTTMIAKLAAAMTCMGLAMPAVATAGPVPEIDDLGGIDEEFALDYGVAHDLEICHILDRRFFKNKPDMVDIDAVVTRVAEQGGFNYQTGAYVIGVAMSSACREHTKTFEDVLGIDFD